jgi:hypothetical protein
MPTTISVGLGPVRAAKKRDKRIYDEQLVNDVSQHQDSKSGTN